jgi:hypothetical protein
MEHKALGIVIVNFALLLSACGGSNPGPSGSQSDDSSAKDESACRIRTDGDGNQVDTNPDDATMRSALNLMCEDGSGRIQAGKGTQVDKDFVEVCVGGKLEDGQNTFALRLELLTLCSDTIHAAIRAKDGLAFGIFTEDSAQHKKFDILCGSEANEAAYFRPKAGC